MAIAVGKLAVPVFRNVGSGVTQGVGQAEADHVARVAIARHGCTDIGARRLDATRDQARRVEEGAVPVEDDQVEAASGHGTRFSRAPLPQPGRAGTLPVDQISSGETFVPSRLRFAIRPPLTST